MAGIGTLNADTSTPSVDSALPGRGQQIGNAGYALGDVYDSYKKAQLDDVAQQTQLAKGARDRLTQIWEAGAANPQMQNDPRVHKQIDQYWKYMTGSGFPVQPGQKFDWNMLAPAKNLDDVDKATMQMLLEAQPADRRRMAQGLHLVGVPDTWLDAPAQASPQRLVAFTNQWQRLVSTGGTKGMSADAYQQWINTNRSLFDQAYGPGAADEALDNPQVFSQMSQQYSDAISKTQATIDQIRARTKNTLGLTPAVQARIKLESAQAANAKSLAELNGIRTKFVGAQLADLPAKDAALTRQYNATAAQRDADTQDLIEKTKQAVITGTSPSAQLNKTLIEANTTYRTISTAYTSALNNSGAVPEELQQAYDSAYQRVQALQQAHDTLADPAVRNAIAAAAVTRRTGQHADPTTGVGNSIPGFNPTNSDSRGNPVMKVNGKWVQSDGTPGVF